MCVLDTLRDQARSKEVWIEGAGRVLDKAAPTRPVRFRNPDEDLPQDFEARREEYYAALEHPREVAVFVEKHKKRMEAALDALDTVLPTLDGVKLKTSKKGKGRIMLTPLSPQAEPPHIVKLMAALVHRWPMTNLLDILMQLKLEMLRLLQAWQRV